MSSKLPTRKAIAQRQIVKHMVMKQALTVPDWEEHCSDLLAANALSPTGIRLELVFRTVKLIGIPPLLGFACYLWGVIAGSGPWDPYRILLFFDSAACLLVPMSLYSTVLLLLQYKKIYPPDTLLIAVGSFCVLYGTFSLAEILAYYIRTDSIVVAGLIGLFLNLPCAFIIARTWGKLSRPCQIQ